MDVDHLRDSAIDRENNRAIECNPSTVLNVFPCLHVR